MKKEIIIEYIENEILKLEAKHGFTNETGTIQVQSRTNSKYRVIAYGKYAALVDLWETIKGATWITEKQKSDTGI